MEYERNVNDMEFILLRKEEVNEKITIILNRYNKGLMYLKDAEDKLNETINNLYSDIYKNTNYTQPEILDFITEIKIRLYTTLAELYKAREIERGKLI